MVGVIYCGVQSHAKPFHDGAGAAPAGRYHLLVSGRHADLDLVSNEKSAYTAALIQPRGCFSLNEFVVGSRELTKTLGGCSNSFSEKRRKREFLVFVDGFSIAQAREWGSRRGSMKDFKRRDYSDAIVGRSDVRKGDLRREGWPALILVVRQKAQTAVPKPSKYFDGAVDSCIMFRCGGRVYVSSFS